MSAALIEHGWSERSGPGILRGLSGASYYFSCDPDDNGALAIWNRAGFVECRGVSDPSFLSWLEGNVKIVGLGRLVLVMETQFLSFNQRSTITMARRAGFVAGALASFARRGVELVNVTPASWQNATARNALGWTKIPKGKTKEMARTVHERWCSAHVSGWDGLSVDRQQGVIDAYGIGYWWRKICAGEWS